MTSEWWWSRFVQAIKVRSVSVAGEADHQSRHRDIWTSRTSKKLGVYSEEPGHAVIMGVRLETEGKAGGDG